MLEGRSQLVMLVHQRVRSNTNTYKVSSMTHARVFLSRRRLHIVGISRPHSSREETSVILIFELSDGLACLPTISRRQQRKEGPSCEDSGNKTGTTWHVHIRQTRAVNFRSSLWHETMNRVSYIHQRRNNIMGVLRD